MFETFDMSLEETVEHLSNQLKDKVGGVLGQRFESSSADSSEYISSFATTEWMSNPGGTLHGGIISAMFDHSLGVHAIQAAKKLPTPTTHLNITFCRPVTIGTRVYVRSRLLTVSRSSLQILGEAWAEGCPEKIVAYATASYHIYPDKK